MFYNIGPEFETRHRIKTYSLSMKWMKLNKILCSVLFITKALCLQLQEFLQDCCNLSLCGISTKSALVSIFSFKIHSKWLVDRIYIKTRVF
jgi:hypothetical protein